MPDTYQVMLIEVTEGQTVRCVLNTKSCAVTCFSFLAQDTKEKQFLGQKYPQMSTMDLIKEPETTINLMENPEPVDKSGIKREKTKSVQMVFLIHSL